MSSGGGRMRERQHIHSTYSGLCDVAGRVMRGSLARRVMRCETRGDAVMGPYPFPMTVVASWIWGSPCNPKNKKEKR